jgi:hypothetical protein
MFRERYCVGLTGCSAGYTRPRLLCPTAQQADGHQNPQLAGPRQNFKLLYSHFDHRMQDRKIFLRHLIVTWIIKKFPI